MSYYADEVPKTLELNTEYTSRQIYLFMIENKHVHILSDSVHLSHDSNQKYTIVDVKEGYVHRQADNGYRVHLLPNTKTRIYQIK